MLASMFSQLFTRWHSAATGAQPAHVDPTLDSCTRYPSLLGGQRQCRMRSLPKAPTHDQCRELKPRPLDLWTSAPPTGPQDLTCGLLEVNSIVRDELNWKAGWGLIFILRILLQQNWNVMPLKTHLNMQCGIGKVKVTRNENSLKEMKQKLVVTERNLNVNVNKTEEYGITRKEN